MNLGRTLGVLAQLLGAASLLPCQAIVHSYPRGAVAPARWAVGRALVEIGGADGVGPAEFSSIVGAVRQSDGRIIVADGTSRELRIFDANGRHSRTITRQGFGPGELSSLGPFTSVGDTLVAIDGRRAVHLFAPDGTWLRSSVLPTVRGYIVNPVFGAFNGTDMVLNLRAGSIENTASVREDSIWLGRVSLRDSSVRVIAAQPLAPLYSIGPGFPPSYPVVFAAHPLNAVRDGRLCLGVALRYQVICVDSMGRPLFEVRRDIASRSVTDSAKRAFRTRRQLAISRLEGSLRAHRERVAAAAQFAATFPLFSQLFLSRTGELWVRAYVTEDGLGASPLHSNAVPSDWSIYDRPGRWVADCRLPARFAPTDIGVDYVLGVSRDSDDVERVTLLPLRRCTAPNYTLGITP